MYNNETRRVSIANNYTKTVSPTGSGKQSWKRKASIFENDDKEEKSFPELLKTFSTTSTLHGISFVGTSGNVLIKLLWLAIVILGLVLSIIGIDQCFKGWEANPVITAVWQVPIESTPFPSITVCPISDERFGYVTNRQANPDMVYVPICKYNSEQDGVTIQKYNDKFCEPKAFQPTFNEYGMCFTYNNRKQGMDEYFRSYHSIDDGENFSDSNANIAMDNDEDLDIVKVKGCGKNRGFQLVLDSQKMFSAITQNGTSKAKGYRVFITLNGVVTSNLPYYVAPDFDGEHNFYLHGVHYIVAGQDFIDWQKDNQICYFPYQKNLTYFDSYSQDNCLLECRVKKISTRCGCAPWFIPRNKDKAMKMGTGDSIDNLPVCTSQGNKCFKDLSKSYNEDLIDRTECDCKNDCEMVHTFSTLQREPFSTNVAEKLILKQELQNYLVDPEHKIIDEGTKDVTKALYNITDNDKFAEERFRKDISVLNFFFDTPIITQIGLKMRVSMFDKLSAIGGTLGLYTGISIITMIETVWWLIQFGIYAFRHKVMGHDNVVQNMPQGVISVAY